jgi:hypothetical protein
MAAKKKKKKAVIVNGEKKITRGKNLFPRVKDNFI